ncbi:MAG: TlpA family protein disulfide reductase [Roseivirga sp.]|nr:TlpA family protein disulfide reductase [Roseivirga sp.]
MKRLLCILIMCTAQMVQAQGKIRVDLRNEYRAPNDIYNPLPLYKLPENNRITYSGSDKEYEIKIPTDISGDVAFTTEFFTGWEDGALDASVLLLITNYTGSEPQLYIDYNQNLDLTDDGAPVNLPDDKIEYIHLYRSDNQQATYTFKVTKNFLRVSRSVEMDAKWMKIITQNPIHGDAEILPIELWFGAKRQNMVSHSVEVNGQKIQLGIMDWDCNGLYNDSEDRLLMGEYESPYLSFNERDGAVSLGEEPLYEIGNKTYEVVHVDPEGDFLEMKVTDKRKKAILKPGDIVADLKFKLINGDTTSIHQFLKKGKVTLIDVWGTWCKPCVSKLPELKTIYEQNADMMNMVAIAYDNKPAVEKFIAKHDIKWVNGMFTKEIISELMVEGYPYFLILNDQGKVLNLGMMSMTELNSTLKSYYHED